MSAVSNIPRAAALNWKWTPKNAVWISIGDPGQKHARNEHLEKLPTLWVEMYDISKKEGEYLPPSKADAEKIVKFLLEHRGRHVIVNCQGGISRSGAVAKFCEAVLGYTWTDKLGKEWADPNPRILKLMKAAYQKIEPTPPIS